MPEKTTEIAAGLASLNGNDEDERAPRLETSQYCHHETEGGSDGALRGRHNFMKAAVETPFRQMSIKGGKTKRQRSAANLLGRPQQAAQFADRGAAVRCRRTGC